MSKASLASDQKGVWTRRIRSLAWLCLIAIAALALFYWRYWAALEALPAKVQQRVATHHGIYLTNAAVNPWLTHALIATEDRSFYRNWGISFEGIGRALLVDIRTLTFAQGGSTITQQLVRDMMLSPRKTIPRKVTGVLLSLMVTALYSKQQILNMYLNEVYLGHDSYGVAKAAHVYFGRSITTLTPADATLLAGLPQAPSAYDPLTHFRLAKDRQWEVLSSMVSDHLISANKAHQIFTEPLHLLK